MTDPLFGAIVDIATPERKQRNKGDLDIRAKKYGKQRSSFATNVSLTENLTVIPNTQSETRFSKCARTCVFCKRNHTLEECMVIREKTHKDRTEFLKKGGYCFGCLMKGHVSRKCKHRMTCQVFSQKHPTILHFAKNKERDNAGGVMSEGTTVSSALVSLSHETKACPGVGEDRCVLAIVPVRVKSKKSNWSVEMYAFMDPGTLAPFCTDALARQLNLTGRRTEIILSTMSPMRRVKSTILLDLEISGLDENNHMDLTKVFTQKAIPVQKGNIPQQKHVERWPYLKEVKLPHIDAEVGLLIGANAHKALEPRKVDNGPYAVKKLLLVGLSTLVTQKAECYQPRRRCTAMAPSLSHTHCQYGTTSNTAVQL